MNFTLANFINISVRAVKNIFSIAMLNLACVVGAGFASGKEILSYFEGFGNHAFFCAFLCGLLIAVASYIFLQLGQMLAPHDLTDVHKSVFGKAYFLADLLVLFNCACIGGAMLASIKETSQIIFPQLNAIIFVFVAIIICFFVLKKGLKGFVKLSVIVSPLMIVFLVFVCVLGILQGQNAINAPVLSINLFLNPFIYVASNMLLCGQTLTAINKKNKKEILFASIFSGIIIGILIYLILFSLLKNPQNDTAMPLLQLAKQGKLYYAFLVCVLLSILTTLISAVYNFARWLSTLFVRGALAITLLICFVVSLFGFDMIVEHFYKWFGVVALFYILACACKCIALKNSQGIKNNALKKAKGLK